MRPHNELRTTFQSLLIMGPKVETIPKETDAKQNVAH